MNDNLSGDMANMNSAFEELKLKVYDGMEAPLRSGVQYITSEVIPALSEWVPEAFSSLMSGLQKLGSSLKPLFETVMKNPKAVGTAITSIAAGFTAMKAVNIASDLSKTLAGVTSFTGALDKLGLSMLSNPWAAGAAAVAAAVTAIGFAVNEYNNMQINESLTAHFGNVELSDDMITDFATRIIDAEWVVNVNTALGHFDNAEQAQKEAEEALAANDALEWKARVGISLTKDEQSTYMQNIADFKSEMETALQEQTLAAEMSIATFDIKMQDGTSLSDKITEWANKDLQDMSYLSSGLTKLVQTALEDGIIDVDEQAAIDQLQQKISNIMSGWKEAEAQAEFDMLTQKYGRLSGADLEEGTFTSLATELGEQRQLAAEALYENEKQVYATLNALNQTNEEGIQRITDSDLAFYKEQVAQASRNAETAMLLKSVNFEKNTMEDAYGDLLTSNYQNIQTGAQTSVDQLSQLYEQYQNGTATMESLFMNISTTATGALAAFASATLAGATDESSGNSGVSTFLDMSEKIKFNSMCFPITEASLQAALLTKIKYIRNSIGWKCQAVAPDFAADFEGIINITNSFEYDGKQLTKAQACAWYAGATAAADYVTSNTYVTVPNATAVVGEKTHEEAELAIKSGETFFSVSDSGEVQVETDINSKVKITSDMPQDINKNRPLRVYDTFCNDCLLNFKPNQFSGKESDYIVIEGLGKEMLKKYEKEGAIQNVDYDNDFVVDRGLSAGDYVVINVGLQAVDSIEKFYITVIAR